LGYISEEEVLGQRLNAILSLINSATFLSKGADKFYILISNMGDCLLHQSLAIGICC
jgi:hypothetical protein